MAIDMLGNVMAHLCSCGHGASYHRAEFENGPRTGSCYGPARAHMDKPEHTTCEKECREYEAV